MRDWAQIAEYKDRGGDLNPEEFGLGRNTGFFKRGGPRYWTIPRQVANQSSWLLPINQFFHKILFPMSSCFESDALPSHGVKPT